MALTYNVSMQKLQVAISMQRGAQSGGIVTLKGSSGGKGVQGVRVRSAPGKRAHLQDEVYRKCQRAMGRRPHAFPGSTGLFMGHTRFATSSNTTESESHPHQWSPPEKDVPVWRVTEAEGHQPRFVKHLEQFEVYVCLNGDFDFWKLLEQVCPVAAPLKKTTPIRIILRLTHAVSIAYHWWQLDLCMLCSLYDIHRASVVAGRTTAATYLLT